MRSIVYSRSRPCVLLLFIAAVAFSSSVRGAEPACAVDDDCPTAEPATTTTTHNSQSWFEEASKDGVKFLQQHVFGQKSQKKRAMGDSKDSEGGGGDSGPFSHLFHEKPKRLGDDETDDADGTRKESKEGGGGGLLGTLKEILSSDQPDEALLQLLLSNSAVSEDNAPSFTETATLFLDHAKEILNQLQRTFGARLDEVMKEHFSIASAWYLLRREQEKKHAYWKSAQHRFLNKETDTNVVKELHQALYLSDLAYVDSEPQIREGLAKVANGAWELIFTDTQGNPSEPAHFVAVEKQAAPLPKDKQSFWQKVTGRELRDLVGQDTLKVLIVVRGTKTLADVLSDGLLEAADFKGNYKAHGGIKQSGHYIVDKQIERLKQLLRVSGRSKIELLLFGHSLGAGSAAIAAMEFHDNYSDIISVQAVGFGCPSLVSPELSEKYQDIITTVIADADVIPRMSGASLINVQLDMLSLDWTDYLLEDLQELGANILNDVSNVMGKTGAGFVQELLVKVGSSIEEYVTTKIKPTIEKAVQEAIPNAIKTPNHRMENELIPPGTCLHLYRTATGFEAAYTPCSYFNEIEYVPHMVQDHMTKEGYHFALLSLLRQQLQDNNAVFENVVA